MASGMERSGVAAQPPRKIRHRGTKLGFGFLKELHFVLNREAAHRSGVGEQRIKFLENGRGRAQVKGLQPYSSMTPTKHPRE